MTDPERLDFLDAVLKAGLPIGFKPNYTALVGTVLIKEGSTNIRELLDNIERFNNEGADGPPI